MLGDPKKRANYDQFGSAEGNPFGGGSSAGGGFGDFFGGGGGFSDIFSDIFLLLVAEEHLPECKNVDKISLSI